MPPTDPISPGYEKRQNIHQKQDGESHSSGYARKLPLLAEGNNSNRLL